MTHTFKNFTPLFLAGVLCLSAAPAQSAESWSSFALKGLGTWATCVGIGLGSAIAHEYGHAITAEILEPGIVHAIAIGATKETVIKQRSYLKPVLFPEGFRLRNAFGIAEGLFVQRKSFKNPLHDIATSVAGPLAAAGFCLLISRLIRSSGLQSCLIQSIVKSVATLELLNLAATSDDYDGDNINKHLGLSKLQYNAIAIPAIGAAAYAIYKIV